MIDQHFYQALEKTYPHELSRDLVEKWRKYESGVYDRANEIIKDLTPYVEIQGKRILDIGSGYGGVAIAFANQGAVRVISLEYDWNRVSLSEYRRSYDHPSNSSQFIQASGQEIPFPKGSFDIVICSDVLEHVSSHSHLISEIGRVLTPGGWLYIIFPNLLSFTNLWKDPHYNLFGVSIMPHWIGKWYVVNVRKVSPTYEVGTFPIASQIINTLRKYDISITKWHPAPHRRIGFLTPLLRLYRLNTQGMMIFICQKNN